MKYLILVLLLVLNKIPFLKNMIGKMVYQDNNFIGIAKADSLNIMSVIFSSEMPFLAIIEY